MLTLILLEPKVISLCHQYTARPACTSVKSDHTLYCLTDQLHVITHLDISKYDKGEFQKWKVEYSILDLAG